MFDNVNQNNVKPNGIDCFYSVEKNMCTRFMVIKSGSKILFHHSNGKSEPVLGTNTCGIFFREQKSLKMHCKKSMMWLQNGSNLYSIFFFSQLLSLAFKSWQYQYSPVWLVTGLNLSYLLLGTKTRQWLPLFVYYCLNSCHSFPVVCFHAIWWKNKIKWQQTKYSEICLLYLAQTSCCLQIKSGLNKTRWILEIEEQ